MKRVSILIMLALFLAAAKADVISYLRFEEGSGFGAYDETGLMHGEVLNFDSVDPGGGDTGYNGWSINVPSATVPLTGDANTGSLRFSGGTDFIDLSNGNALSLGTAFTIELYFRPDDPGLGSPIFGFSPASSLGFNITDSLGGLEFGAGFQGYNAPPVPADDVQIGQWQHLAMVKEPGQYSIYLDGVLLATEALPSGTDGPYFFPGTGTTGDRTIGVSYSGWIDEFRISDEALTPDQFLIVPEPSTIMLVVLGCVGLYCRRRQTRN